MTILSWNKRYRFSRLYKNVFWRPSLVVFYSLAVLLSGCGGGGGGGDSDGGNTGIEPSTFTVDSSGGTINFVNPQNSSVNVTLIIPPGSVADSTSITVSPTPNYPANPNLLTDSVFQFGPEGLSFNPPAQITISYDPSLLV